MNDIKKAIDALNKGGIVIFPTDTAYGIGCRIDREEAIEKLFRLRKRPETQATPVLVADKEMAKKYVEKFDKNVENLMEKYWPGALTIVLPSVKEKVPNLVRGGGENIGIRMPNHEITLSLIRGVGVPILGPSANFHSDPTPYSFSDLNGKLISLVDFVIEGEVYLKKASTVLDCSQRPWKILREGSIDIKI